jgi:hypothetical protein
MAGIQQYDLNKKVVQGSDFDLDLVIQGLDPIRIYTATSVSDDTSNPATSIGAIGTKFSIAIKQGVTEYSSKMAIQKGELDDIILKAQSLQPLIESVISLNSLAMVLVVTDRSQGVIYSMEGIVFEGQSATIERNSAETIYEIPFKYTNRRVLRAR